MHVIVLSVRWNIGVTSVIVGLTSLIRPVATGVGLLGVVEHLGIIESTISVATVAH